MHLLVRKACGVAVAAILVVEAVAAAVGATRVAQPALPQAAQADLVAGVEIRAPLVAPEHYFPTLHPPVEQAAAAWSLLVRNPIKSITAESSTHSAESVLRVLEATDH